MRRTWNHLGGLILAAGSLSTVGCASLDAFAPGGDKVASQKDLEEDFQSKLVRGRNLERAGDWDKAEKLYDALLDEHADDWRVQHRAAVAADNLKRFNLAQERYTKAIQLNPKDAQLFNDLGYCLYLQGQLEKAESAMAKAVRLEPDNSRYRNNYGMVLGQQGDLDAAFEQFAKGGSEADAFYNVAFIYASNDDAEAAMDCFELALESDPTHEQARKALDSFVRDERGESTLPLSEGRLVRYEEDGEAAASAAVFEGEMPENRRAGQATRRLHDRARNVLDQRMSSQRNQAGGGETQE